MLRTIVAAGLLLWSFAAPANDVGDARVVAEVKETITAWVDAFNVRDAQRVAALYASDAVFWGTVSPTIRITPAKVFEYFESSVVRNPKLRISVEEQHVRVYGDVATNSGIYMARNPQPDGEDLVTVARFTFVYQLRDGHWIIVAHHSSRMPEK